MASFSPTSSGNADPPSSGMSDLQVTNSGNNSESSKNKRKHQYYTRSHEGKMRIDERQYGRVQENLRDTVMNYSIDPNDYRNQELISMTMVIFQHYELFDEFQFDEETATNFIRLVAEMYNPDNYFHNFKHAWGVMHMSFHILLNGASRYVDKFDILTILVAAICHDVCHPGNSNAFEVATQTNVSKIYKHKDEICVLERYHAKVTHKLLTADETSDHDILAALSPAQKERFHQQVDFIIMGTDMGKHSVLVEEARNFAALHGASGNADSVVSQECKSSASSSSVDPCVSSSLAAQQPFLMLKSNSLDSTLFDAEERRNFTRIVVHSADIGAQTQSQAIALKWVERVYSEYRLQADRERKLGIMTSPFLHDLKEESKIFSTQSSFIQDIVEPIWLALVQMIPDLKFALDQLVANKLHYQALF